MAERVRSDATTRGEATPGALVVGGDYQGLGIIRSLGRRGIPTCVIDDEQWILDLAGELLRAEGHEVQTAQGGPQALDVLSRRKFDVIVSDWKMPGLNGVRLYEHLRSTDVASAKRVLFMTGDVVSERISHESSRFTITAANGCDERP